MLLRLQILMSNDKESDKFLGRPRLILEMFEEVALTITLRLGQMTRLDLMMARTARVTAWTLRTSRVMAWILRTARVTASRHLRGQI